MATREINVTVTLDEDSWRDLEDAAECAGMGLEAYICWGVRLLAEGNRPGQAPRSAAPGKPLAARRIRPVIEEPESVAWAESFAERLSHFSVQFRSD